MSVFYYYHGIRKTNYNECSVVYRNVPYHSVPTVPSMSVCDVRCDVRTRTALVVVLMCKTKKKRERRNDRRCSR
jgi:hypothetical protein